MTADDAEALLHRVESQHDAATPSGLGVIVEVLLRLEQLGEAPAGSRAAVEATLMRYRSALGQPMAFASLLTAALWADPQAAKVELRGGSEQVAEFARLVRSERLLRPERLALRRMSASEGKVGGAGGSTGTDEGLGGAVVCRGQACSLVVHAPEALRGLLRGDVPLSAPRA